MNEKTGYKWTNWAGNCSCIAGNYFEPETEEEICNIVANARKSCKKIRVAGAGHSFSPIVLSDEYLVSLQNFRKCISVSKDEITVQGGMFLYELYSILKKNNLAFPNYGVINRQTIAGALATGTHGSGKKHKSLSSNIKKIRIVTASGEPLEIDRQTTMKCNGHELNVLDAAAVSLGLFGIVSEITLACEPLYFILSGEEVVHWNEYLENMDVWAGQYEYFKAWWFPHTESVYVYKAGRAESSACSGKIEKYTEEQKKLDSETDLLTSPLFKESNENPSLIPGINQYARDLFFTPRVRVGDCFEILVHDETVPMIVSEYGLPVNGNVHREALEEFKTRIEQSGLGLHYPVDLRYAAAENSWLSPACNSDTFYIGMCVREYSKKEIPPQMKLFFEVMRKHKARPNWGKLSDVTPGELKELYPQIGDFISLKNHFDPGNCFGNRFTDMLLQ